MTCNVSSGTLNLTYKSLDIAGVKPERL